MNIEQANKTFDHKITDGAEYCWNCWPNARFLNYENQYAYASIVFNTLTGELYEATVNSEDDDTIAYRWLNSEWRDVMFAESASRGVSASNAWNGVDWTDLEVWNDFAEKASAIWNNIDYDRRVSVPLELSDEEFMQIARQAHKQDVTFNRMVEIILQRAIDIEKIEDNNETRT